jgi:hypothetical protein
MQGNLSRSHIKCVCSNVGRLVDGAIEKIRYEGEISVVIRWVLVECSERFGWDDW